MSEDKKIEYFMIQDGQEGDDCLHRPGFNVNASMFIKNKAYNEIIHKVIEYMKTVLCTTFNDYGKLKGISGANIGIPFNIVAVLHNKKVEVFINPVVTKVSCSKVTVQSNCGSINLPKPISVDRHTWILVKWMDVEGNNHEKRFTDIACTLQHEVDHNQGILITDLEKREKGD